MKHAGDDNMVSKLKNKCLFCEPWSLDQKDQILLRSDHFYLFAGLGPVVEGYVIIAPYRCDDIQKPLNSLSDLTPDLVDELVFLRGIVSAFYRNRYQQDHVGMSFEHGRIPGCLHDIHDTRHCFHAHLCCYPVSFPLWEQMHGYQVQEINGYTDLCRLAGGSTYFFIQASEVDEKNSGKFLKKEKWINKLVLLKDGESPPSQYLRRLLGERVGEKERWDWASLPCWDAVKQFSDDFIHWLLNDAREKYEIGLDEDRIPSIQFLKSITRSNQVGNDYVADQFNRTWRGREQYHAVGRFLRHLPFYAYDTSNKSGLRPRILDGGCGPGFYLKVFDSLGLDWVGIDISPNMLSIASKTVHPHDRLEIGPECKLIRMNAFKPSFKKESFDGVWFSAMLVHIPKRQIKQTLQTLFNILKENGVLYISSQTGGDTVVRREGRVFFYYDDRELQALFREIGFTLIEAWDDSTDHGTCGDQSQKNWMHYLLGKPPQQTIRSDVSPVMVDIGEQGLLNHIRKIVPATTSKDIVLGVGDDCAVLRVEKDELIVATTDPCPMPVVSMLEKDDPWYYGWFSLAISLSDLGSMGARPMGILLAIEAEERMPLKDLDRFYKGAIEASEMFDCPIIGGNIKDASRFNCVGTALGSVAQDKMMTRDAARPGEKVIVLGEMGRFWTWVIHKLESIPLSAADEAALLRWVGRPIPRVKEGQAIARHALSQCAMDSSDGLVACFYDMARSGQNIDLHIDLSDLSMDPVVEMVAEKAGIDVRKLLLSWGDWELVCTVKPDNMDRLRTLMEDFSCPLYSVGYVTEGRGNVIFHDNNHTGPLTYLTSERFTERSYFSHGLNHYLACLREKPLFEGA